MSDRHAVVIGGSLAGLMAAKVLADRVGHVSIVERDVLPDGPDSRKGVPQGRHAHGLLAAGDQVVRRLFPGLMEALVAGGAQVVTTEEGRWWQCDGYRTDAPGASDATFFSRPYFEAGVRDRVRALPNVTFVPASVRRLVATGGRVTGVEVEQDGLLTTLDSDIVIDASGRGSAAPKWLESLGYSAPPVAQVHVDMGYATRIYRRSGDPEVAGRWVVTISDPERSKRVGVAFPIEGERWIVTLAGCHGDHAPTDDDGFLAWAQTLPTGDIASIVGHEEPLGPIVTHRLPSSQWRHYEKLKRHPAGFLVLGDAICSFNPIYGQGMSSAALQAAALGRSIDRRGIGSPSLHRDFYKAARKIIANPWAIAAGGDFSYAETTGAKPPMADAVNRYVKKAIIAAQHDGAVATAIFDVQNLLAPPPSLMKPAMMRRVLRGAKQGPTGTARYSEPVAVSVGNRR